MQGLMGYPGEPYARVIYPSKTGALSILDATTANWDPSQGPVPNDNDLAPVLYPIAWNKLNVASIASNKKEIETYIRLMTKPGPNPPTSVMVQFRDGSPHLMKQTGDAIDQIYDTYQAVYGKLAPDAQPQIYLIGHSFGGIVARAIVTNPIAADLFGKTLTPAQRVKADFIRARTVWIATLSSPHLGTMIGDPAGDVAAFIRQTGGTLAGAFGTLDSLFGSEPLKSLGLPTNMQKTALEIMQKGLDAVSGQRDCLEDLMRVQEYNRGILRPDLARRGPNGTVVPIYTMTGRNPGGLFFDRVRGPVFISGRWMPNSIFDIKGSGRFATDALALYAINAIMHELGYGKEGKRVWGTATIPDGDRISSPFKGIGPSKARPVAQGLQLNTANLRSILWDVITGKPYTFGSDGEWDNDGFLGFDSGHGIGLPGAWYRLYDQSNYGPMLPWDFDNHGSMMFNIGTGMFIHNELLMNGGPVAAAGRLSSWGSIGAPTKKLYKINVQVTQVYDVANDLDTLSKADFTMYTRIAGSLFTQTCPDDTREVKTLKANSVANLPQSVIPINFSVIERDTPDPDDYCTISPAQGRDNAIVYYDTRTKRIFGDVTGDMGEELTLIGRKGMANRVQIKFKITEN